MNKFQTEDGITFDDVNIVPRYSRVASRKDCDVSSWLGEWKLKVPLISSPMDTVTGHDMAKEMHRLGGLGILHRFCTIDEQVAMIPDVDTTDIPLGAAVGIRDDYMDRVDALISAGVSVILVDVAHGHHSDVATAIRNIKAEHPCYLIAGSVATYEGTVFLRDNGADCVRVGIGNGSLCETRIRTGVGVPQITALHAARAGIVDIIADGGMRMPGDVAKAFGIGANFCMFGSLFAGTKETPGAIQRMGSWPNEILCKSYRGSASRSAKLASGQEDRNIEGNSKIIPYKGRVERIINDLMDGLRSSMSYVGAKDLMSFYDNVTFTVISQASQIEAHPHLLL